jgi:hypothetical protein
MTHRDRLNEVFASAVDFDLCDSLTTVIENRYSQERLLHRDKSIPNERWVIYTVLSYDGFFQCEGYSCFWGANIDHRGYADALDEVGLPILASILRDYYDLVPEKYLGDFDAVQSDRKSRRKRKIAAEHMDEKLITEAPDIVGKLAAYIRTRRYSFLDCIDDIEQELERQKTYRL